jgi:recombination protein RecT
LDIKGDKQIVNYGGELHLLRSYTGTIHEISRLKGVIDIKAYCIYEGDEFEQQYNIETAALKISKFNPKFENIDVDKIKGAFAVVIGETGIIHTEIMNINQIKVQWQKSIEKDDVSPREVLTDEAAKKIVINRACKNFIDISDERAPFIEANTNRDKRCTRELKEENNNEALKVKEDLQVKEVLEVIEDLEVIEGPDF